MKRKILLLSFLLLILLPTAFLIREGLYYYRLARIGAGYKAKILCSGIFVSKRDLSDILREDLPDPRFKYFSIEVDYERKSVSSQILCGLVSRTATYHPGFGSVLDLEERLFDRPLQAPFDLSNHLSGWPQPNISSSVALIHDNAKTKLDSIVNAAFIEQDQKSLKRTRALLIVYRNQIIAEQYSDGISARTPLPGWSMTKSVLNAFVGILAEKGLINIEQSVSIPKWQNDERAKITWDHLLRMNSGLQFEESYKNKTSDVITMLFNRSDAAKYAIEKPMISAVGQKWSYSSGTSNILSWLIRQRLKDDQVYYAFPYLTLFWRIGAQSVVIEPDASGNFIASSFMYATARDWARIGLLYLNEGNWFGQQILSKEWIDYTRTPTVNSKNLRYAAHFWLKLPDDKKLPEDLFYASGHYGQYLTIIPSYDLVIVRLGMTTHSGAWNQDQFVLSVCSLLCAGT